MRTRDEKVHVFGRSDMGNSLATLIVFRLERESTTTERLRQASQIATFLRESLSTDMIDEVVAQLGTNLVIGSEIVRQCDKEVRHDV